MRPFYFTWMVADHFGEQIAADPELTRNGAVCSRSAGLYQRTSNVVQSYQLHSQVA